MKQRKKAIFIHSATGEIKEMESFADDPYFLRKAERAKEILKNVKFPDEWTPNKS